VNVLAARGLVVKHADAAELRIVFAAVLAAAADIAAATTSPPKTWCPSGYRTGPHACAQSRAEKRPGGGKHAGKKGRAGEESNVHISVWQFGTGNRKCSGTRACIPSEITKPELELIQTQTAQKQILRAEV
jgi:hypothetical protein